MKIACPTSTESRAKKSFPLEDQILRPILMPTVNFKIQNSQLIPHLFIGTVKRKTIPCKIKLVLTRNTKQRMASSGKDLLSFKITNIHHFGDPRVFYQRLPSKVLLVIAGSFHQLLQSLLIQRESIKCSKIRNIQRTVHSKCISMSEAREQASLSMIEFQLLTLMKDTPLHILLSTPSHLHKELGG